MSEAFNFKANVNTKENYITLHSKSSVFLLIPKYENKYIKLLENYKFYYSTNYSILEGITSLYDSSYLKAISFLINNLLEEINNKSSISYSIEDFREVLNNFKYIPTIAEEKILLNTYKYNMVNYGIGTSPGEMFLNSMKIDLSSPSDINKYKGILYKLLFYSVYNIEVEDIEQENESNIAISQIPLNIEFLKKTFSNFKCLSGFEITGPSLIMSKKNEIIEEIYKEIENFVKTILEKKINNDVFLNIGKETFNIYYYDYNSEIIEKDFLNSLSTKYENAKYEYKKLLEGEREEEANGILNKLLLTNFNFEKENEDWKNISYEGLVLNWSFLSFYNPFYDSSIVFENKVRSINEIVELIKKERLGNVVIEEENLKTAMSNGYDYTYGYILDRYLKKEEETSLYLRIKNAVVKDFEETKKEVLKSKINEKVYLDLIQNQNLYLNIDSNNKSRKKLFDEINKRWKYLAEKYKSILEEGGDPRELKDEILGKSSLVKQVSIYSAKKDYISIGTLDVNNRNILNAITPEDLENSKEAIKNDITNRLSALSFYRVEEKSTNEYSGVGIKYSEYDSLNTIYWNENYKENKKADDAFKSFKKDLSKSIEEYLSNISIASKKEEANKEKTIEEIEITESYLINEISKLENSSTEKDFFFIKDFGGNKVLPSSKFLDIEFLIYKDYNNANNFDYISVSKRNKDIPSNTDSIYSDNYFSSFELKDLGGEREVVLTLKSKNEKNLENIIFKSIGGPAELSYNYSNGINIKNTVESTKEILKRKNINFRMRFGYSDIVEKKEETIQAEEFLDGDFLNRTENMKPVLKSPWMYFQIISLETKATENELIYIIKGITIGSNILNNYSLFRISKINNESILSFEESSPIEGISHIGSVLHKASGGMVNILSGENKIFVKNEYIRNSNYKIVESRIGTNNNKIIGKNLNEEIPSKWSDINPQFLRSVSVNNEKRYLNIEDKRAEEKNKFSIKKILDELMDWLPEKRFYIQGSLATEINSETVNLLDNQDNKKNLVSIKPSYEIIECESSIENEDSSFKKRIFINIYYKGPRTESIPIRKYTYKFKQESIIKNLSIENEIGLANIVDYCSIVRDSMSYLYTTDFYTGIENFGARKNNITILKEDDINQEENIIMVPTESIVMFKSSDGDNNGSDSSSIENNIKIEDEMKKYAEIFLMKLERWPYKGTIEILGDPFYFFDYNLQAGKYLIFLDFRRITNNFELERSYYTGLYYITGIEHNMSSDGDFTTRLSILKHNV
jgi:hypothetical protein